MYNFIIQPAYAHEEGAQLVTTENVTGPILAIVIIIVAILIAKKIKKLIKK